jgi:hypothetical protein
MTGRAQQVVNVFTEIALTGVALTWGLESMPDQSLLLTESSQLEHKGPRVTTDRESFTEVAANLAGRRLKSEKRKYPRFPTPEALNGEAGSTAFSGAIICRRGDSHSEPVNEASSQASGAGATVNQDDDQEEVRGFHVIDFSEDGLQLQFHCEDLLRFSRKRLYLQMDRALIPVSFRWCKQSGINSRGGFAFDDSIDSNPYLATLLAGMGNKLIDFLTTRLTSEHNAGREQDAVLAYISIFYTLRLTLLRSMASLNDLIRFLKHSPRTACQPQLESPLRHGYSKTFQLDCARRFAGRRHFKELLKTFMTPYYKYGCCLTEVSENSVLLDNDAFSSIINSIIVAGLASEGERHLTPDVQSLYSRFNIVRYALPGVFTSRAFDDQFHLYNSVIVEVELLRDKLIDVLSNLSGQGARL